MDLPGERPRPKVLYVGGSGRSGSTLLARLLGAEAGHAAAGELRYVWERGFAENHLCECGRPFRSCPFWCAVVDEAFGGFDAVDSRAVLCALRSIDRIRYVPQLLSDRIRTGAFRGRVLAAGEVLERLYTAIASASGRPVVVDSSKDASYAFVLHALDELGTLDVAVAQLVRDSRAVAHSWTRTKVRPEIHWESTTMARHPPAASALLWDAHNVLFELYERVGSRFARVRYEDLVARPETVVSTVVALHGPRESPASGELGHSISGNPMRFDRGPLRVQLDDEWVSEMARRDRLTVTAATAPFLARYGYHPFRPVVREGSAASTM